MAERGIMFQCEEALKKELDILSKREGRTLKEIMSELIKEYVKTHKEGNPQHLILKFMENEDFTGFPAMAIDYSKKKEYVLKFLQEDGKLNKLGRELWGHVSQWQLQLEKL